MFTCLSYAKALFIIMSNYMHSNDWLEKCGQFPLAVKCLGLLSIIRLPPIVLD